MQGEQLRELVRGITKWNKERGGDLKYNLNYDLELETYTIEVLNNENDTLIEITLFDTFITFKSYINHRFNLDYTFKHSRRESKILNDLEVLEIIKQVLR